MPFRSRLASCALGVVLLQLAMLFAVPFSACCAAKEGQAHHTSARSAESSTEIVDCCPAGSHPPGQCPLHRSARKSSRTSATDCRIRCSAPQVAAFVAGVVGVLPRPAAITVVSLSFDIIAVRADAVIARAAHPEAPPPKLL